MLKLLNACIIINNCNEIIIFSHIFVGDKRYKTQTSENLNAFLTAIFFSLLVDYELISY